MQVHGISSTALLVLSFFDITLSPILRARGIQTESQLARILHRTHLLKSRTRLLEHCEFRHRLSTKPVHRSIGSLSTAAHILHELLLFIVNAHVPKFPETLTSRYYRLRSIIEYVVFCSVNQDLMHVFCLSL